MTKLSRRPIIPLRVRFEKTIASFDSKANNNQPSLIKIDYDKHAIRPNATIIILLIKNVKQEA